MWCVVEGVSVMVNVVGSLQLLMSVWYGMMWCDKRIWTLLRFLIWEMDRLVGRDNFTPKMSVLHKFDLTVLNSLIWHHIIPIQ